MSTGAIHINIIIKATLFTLAIGFGGTAVASPNGGLVDRINDTRSYPNKTVETGTQNGQEQQRMMENKERFIIKELV